MANRTKWEPVAEMDLDDGTHTCYSTTDKCGHFVWLTQISDDSWDVERSCRPGCGEGFTTLVNCKTLTSAKRWAARYLDI
jgi:hypothetical protein